MVTVDYLLTKDGNIKKNVKIAYNEVLTNVVEKDKEKLLIGMPAFVNAHVHSADYSLLGNAYGKNTSELVGRNGIKTKWLKKASEKQTKKNISSFLKENLKKGVYTVIDFREGGISGAKIAKNVAQEFDLNYLILGRTPDPKEISALAESVDGIGIPDAIRWPRKDIEEIVEEAHNHNLITAMHVAETRKVQKEFLQREGETDTEFAIDLGIDLLVHLTNANKWDLREVKRSTSYAVFSPRTNMLLEAQFPPVEEFLRDNIPFLLGTDNAFLNSPNMLREIDFTARTIKHKQPRYLKQLINSATNISPINKTLMKRNSKRKLKQKFIVIEAPEYINKDTIYEWLALHAEI